MKHELKMLPEYFQVAWAGDKPFEIRKNDRNFKERDEIILQEYDPLGKEDPHLKGLGCYTGREIHGFIRYLTDYEQKPGYVVFYYEESHRVEE